MKCRTFLYKNRAHNTYPMVSNIEMQFIEKIEISIFFKRFWYIQASQRPVTYLYL